MKMGNGMGFGKALAVWDWGGVGSGIFNILTVLKM
jgi:hypothetical protein